MKKRVLAVFMAMVLSFGMTGCRGENTAATMNGNAEQHQITAIQNTQQNDQTSRYDISVEQSKDQSAENDMPYEYPEVEYEDVNAADDLSAMMAAEAPLEKGMFGEEIEQITWNTEEYKYLEENRWMSVKTSPFSTFAADVDTASYANVRRMLLRGQIVPADAVRIEEMVNYFHYDYPNPKAGEPFSVTTEIAPCPWNEETALLMVGLSTKQLDTSERVPSNLVFLVDVSGSMDDPDKLPLVQRSFKLLCEELGENDRISLVTYASGDRVVLEGVSGEEKAKISDAVEDLFASGGTNGSAGIQTAYQLAEKYFIEGGNNRVILATDGDLNIGITDEGSLTRLIKEKAKSGVFLSVLGFGWGNISDTRMEALADNGNGNYSYIDNIAEARKVLIEEMGSTLFTVAKDVKFQVEFNPANVKGYRLIGYENRTMAAEDFADDTKDGGEIGAGHQVTALYEIAFADSAQNIPEVQSRYGNTVSKENTGITDTTDTGSDVKLTDASRDAGDGNDVKLSDATKETDTAKVDGERMPYADELLTVNVRYKEPDGDTSKLLVYPVDGSSYHQQMSDNLSWAAGVAQAGMILKDSAFAGNSKIGDVKSRLEELDSVKGDDYRTEFLYMLTKIQ